MSIQCELEHKNLIIYIDGDIDHHETEMIRDRIDGYIRSGQAKNLIFDFANVSFMDSSGIGLLMGRYRNIKDIGGKVMLSNISPQLNRVLKISGIYNLMDQFESIDDAIKAI